MMKRLKQVILFLLVIITIYSTMLFYLLMSVHADSRLQEIDYIEKTKTDLPQKVLYIDRLVPIDDRLKYFTLSRVSHKQPKGPGCQLGQYRQGVLLIAASSFDAIGIYPKILRELQAGVDNNCVPEVFVLKRLFPLVLNTEQSINQYAYQIGQVLKYFTIEAQFQISIFTHEQGAILTLVYLAGKNLNPIYHRMIDRLKTVILVDLTHPFLRVEYDPPYKILNRLKMLIANHRDRMRIFNRLKFVIVTTHKEDSLNQHFYYEINGQKYVFGKTLLINSREMANVHYFLPPNPLSFPPLVRRLSHMLAKDFVRSLSLDQIGSFLKYGQSYAHEKKEQNEFNQCQQTSMSKNSEVIMMGQCLKLSPFQLEEEQALVMYSANHFQVYSNTYTRVYPFDNLTQGSIYVFQRMSYPLFVLNPQKNKVYVTKQSIASPLTPLSLDQQDILYSSQLLFSNYSVVRICPDVLLTFPLHFAQGNLHRRFLAQGDQHCFIQSSLFQNFSWQLFLNWSLFRNMVIFTLICSLLRKQSSSERILEQFFINMVILIGRDNIDNKITCGIYISSFSILVEYISKTILYLASFITIKQSWGPFVLFAVSTTCIVGALTELFNFWKFFGVMVVLFINQKSLPLFLIKMYFLKQDFPLNAFGMEGVTKIALLSMWLYTCLHQHTPALQEQTYWSAEQIFTGALMLSLAIGVEWSGSTIQTFITIYMKLLIVLRMLRIMRK